MSGADWFKMSARIDVPKLTSENTKFFHRWKNHCMDDLLFDWFGFDQTSNSLVHSIKAKHLNLPLTN